MTQEEKELLMKGLCAKLPYGLLCKIDGCTDSKKLVSIHQEDKDNILCLFENDGSHNLEVYISEIKPYLRPMTDMTEEEKEELRSEFCADIRDEDNGRHTETYGYVTVYHNFKDESWYIPFEAIDWLNEHHFDYRGLIEKGLALPAPKGMYTKKI